MAPGATNTLGLLAVHVVLALALYTRLLALLADTCRLCPRNGSIEPSDDGEQDYTKKRRWVGLLGHLKYPLAFQLCLCCIVYQL